MMANTWISNSLYVVALSRSIAWGERWLFFFFFVYRWNCWPSLFKLYFHRIKYSYYEEKNI